MRSKRCATQNQGITLNRFIWKQSVRFEDIRTVFDLFQSGYFFFTFDRNRPFPSSKKTHFQNEVKCETFVVKMSFICIIVKNHFHINGFALSLALKVRFFGTRKWPILVTITSEFSQIIASIQVFLGILARLLSTFFLLFCVLERPPRRTFSVNQCVRSLITEAVLGVVLLLFWTTEAPRLRQLPGPQSFMSF